MTKCDFSKLAAFGKLAVPELLSTCDYTLRTIQLVYTGTLTGCNRFSCNLFNCWCFDAELLRQSGRSTKPQNCMCCAWSIEMLVRHSHDLSSLLNLFNARTHVIISQRRFGLVFWDTQATWRRLRIFKKKRDNLRVQKIRWRQFKPWGPKHCRKRTGCIERSETVVLKLRVRFATAPIFSEREREREFDQYLGSRKITNLLVALR